MRDKIIYCVLTLTLIMEPSIDGLCQFVQNFIITLDSPIFANRYLWLILCRRLKSWIHFSYLVMRARFVLCEWRKVVNLVSIYQCYEHFCTIFCFAFLSQLSLYRFVSIYFSCYTFCYKLQSVHCCFDTRMVISLVSQWI